MTDAHLMSLLSIFSQALFIGFVLLGLFKLRSKFGLVLLYMVLGAFQYMQTALASMYFIEIYPGVSVSPGSSVLFTASLFTVLLLYIKANALEARKLIYGLIFVNISVGVYSFLLSWQSELAISNASSMQFVASLLSNPGLLIAGSLILILDVFLVILLFELLSKYIPILWLTLFLSVTMVQFVDSYLFVDFILLDGDVKGLVANMMIGKTLTCLLFSVLFSAYLYFFEQAGNRFSLTGQSIKSIFAFLAYRNDKESNDQ